MRIQRSHLLIGITMGFLGLFAIYYFLTTNTLNGGHKNGTHSSKKLTSRAAPLDTGLKGDKPAKSKAKVRSATPGSSSSNANTTSESKPPAKNYITYDGNLSSSLIADLGITLEQFGRLQSKVSSYWWQLASWAAKDIYYDEAAAKSSPDGANVYRLPAMNRDARKALEDELSSRLRVVSNDRVANAILEGMDENKSFAYMGKYDTVFRFKQLETVAVDPKTMKPIGPAVASGNEMTVSYSFFNPESGRAVLTSSNVPFDTATETFGNIFQNQK